MDGDIVIKNGYIVGIGNFLDVEKIIDVVGVFIVFGFIDVYVYVESVMVIFVEFVCVLFLNGVIMIVIDLYEIVNVVGEKGIEFMLEDVKGVLIDMFVMFLFFVFVMEGEYNGEILYVEKFYLFYRYEKVIGFVEVMDFLFVVKGSLDILIKIIDVKKEGG